ncbi:uncharacterized protein F5891DRAFT_1179966 [Suillus fuscotomentosus]|uniref:Uncharacterized protein n=1 Tax=Suillus fuscotomentosus TaxID=1912939 RepID=A0AAD4ELT2_9AGAM|nr:uncharacterized protein F5891DRAFT_1179966 [Suillus fuscotomentosus]KAG1908447.1 hypothetical protein F5891DRAFT_1179966 [Suillus fuscotomentosus]
MSYSQQNSGHERFPYAMYNNTLGIHQVVHPHQISDHPSFINMPISSASNPSIQYSGSTSHSVEKFVPMDIPQYNKDGSSTVMFQVNTERNSLSIPLEKCLQPSGGAHLKNAQEIMFPTVDRTQVQTFNLVIAWPGYDTVEFPIDIGTNEKPITRADLARQIAYHFFGFFIQCDSGHLTQRSLFQWKVGGRDGYKFHQIRLSTFWNIEGTSWAASVRVLENA